MRSFISIVSLASLAFATVASALPTSTASFVEPPPEAQPYLPANSFHSIGTDGWQSYASKRSPAEYDGYAVGAALSPRGDEPSQGIPDIITVLNDKLFPICHDLSDKIFAAPSPYDALKISLEALGRIKDLLTTAKGEIESLVANPVESVFHLNGKLLDASAIAQILAVLTVTVTTALGFVIKACISVQTDELVNLVSEISGILAAIIALLAKVIATLITDLVPLIHCALDIIEDLKLTALIEVLKIATA